MGNLFQLLAFLFFGKRPGGTKTSGLSIADLPSIVSLANIPNNLSLLNTVPVKHVVIFHFAGGAARFDFALMKMGFIKKPGEAYDIEYLPMSYSQARVFFRWVNGSFPDWQVFEVDRMFATIGNEKIPLGENYVYHESDDPSAWLSLDLYEPDPREGKTFRRVKKNLYTRLPAGTPVSVQGLPVVQVTHPDDVRTNRYELYAVPCVVPEPLFIIFGITLGPHENTSWEDFDEWFSEGIAEYGEKAFDWLADKITGGTLTKIKNYWKNNVASNDGK